MISTEMICLIAGPLITVLVSGLKSVNLINQYPKVFAALVSAIGAIVAGLTFWDLNWQEIAVCVITPFSAAVATYEVSKTVTSKEH